MTTIPMSETELLTMLRARCRVPDVSPPMHIFVADPDEALALLTSWRDAAVWAEREACAKVADDAPAGAYRRWSWGQCHEAIASEIRARTTEPEHEGLCSDCPPVGYPTEETRCLPCPRRPTGAPIPMKCFVCNRRDLSLYRINPTGQKGVWACEKHLKHADIAVDPELKEIVRLLESEPKENRSHD